MTLALILAIIEKMFIYGPGVITEIAPLFQDREDEPTADEIRDLKITKEPLEYFE